MTPSHRDTVNTDLLIVDVYENRRRDKVVAEVGMTQEEADHQGRLNAESDMTDVENIHFRYVL